MKLDYTVPGQVLINMVDYIKSMVDGFPEQYLKGSVSSPWNENLFRVRANCPKLDKGEQSSSIRQLRKAYLLVNAQDRTSVRR